MTHKNENAKKKKKTKTKSTAKIAIRSRKVRTCKSHHVHFSFITPRNF